MSLTVRCASNRPMAAGVAGNVPPGPCLLDDLRALGCDKAPPVVLVDEDMRVPTRGRERCPGEAAAHRRAPRDHGGPVIQAHAPVRRLDAVERDLAVADHCDEGG